jgi:hypothetical protein
LETLAVFNNSQISPKIRKPTGKRASGPSSKAAVAALTKRFTHTEQVKP